MKLILIIILLGLSNISNSAQPEFIWSKQFGGNNNFGFSHLSGGLNGYVGTINSLPVEFINENGDLECHVLVRYVDGEITTTGDIGEIGGSCPILSGSFPFRSVESFGTDICVGGDFTNLGGVSGLSYFACYSPTLQWYQPGGIGNGPNQSVYTIELDVSGTFMYVGGAFTQTGAVPAKRIVKTDGLTWTPLYSDNMQLDNGVNATVTAIHSTASFTFVGTGNSVQSWNPTIPEWKPLGTHNGSGGIGDIVSFGQLLTASTNMATLVSGDPGGSISDYDIGAEIWSERGSSQGVDVKFGQLLYGLGPLYASGDFTSVDPNANGLAVFMNNDWQAVENYQQLGTLASDAIIDMEQGSTDFCMVAQSHPSDAEIFWNSLVCFDGTDWFGSNNYPQSNVIHSLAKFQGNIIHGGDFINVGDRKSNFIAQLENDRWKAISQLEWSGSGTGYVRHMQKFNGELYATGLFDSANGVGVNQIAKWDGSSWQATTPGFFATNNSPMTLWDNKLVLAGVFNGLNSIVTWDGVNLVKLDGFFGAIDFEVYNGELLATDGTGDVMRYNGTGWDTLISNIQVIHKMKAVGSDLFIGGIFSGACNGGNFISADNIMRWDGSSCHSVGGGVVNNSSASEYVNDIAVYDGNIIVAGKFDTAGAATVSHLAYWDGVNWNSLGQGLQGSFATALFVNENDLYIAGAFSQAGDAIVNNFAKVELILDGVFKNGFDL